MGKNMLSATDSKVKSHATDRNGRPAWAIKDDGAVVLAESFVEQGTIKIKSLTA